MTTAATKSLVYYQTNSIRKFLQNLSSKQRLQSCLIVTPSCSKFRNNNLEASRRGRGGYDDNYLSTFVDRTMFAISMEAGMRSVQSNVIDSYPTVRVSWQLRLSTISLFDLLTRFR